MSNSLWPHRLQHARPSCPSATPRVYSNSGPSSRWCHPTVSSSVVPLSFSVVSVSSSVVPFSSCPQENRCCCNWSVSFHHRKKVFLISWYFGRHLERKWRILQEHCTTFFPYILIFTEKQQLQVCGGSGSSVTSGWCWVSGSWEHCWVIWGFGRAVCFFCYSSVFSPWCSHLSSVGTVNTLVAPYYVQWRTRDCQET